MATRQAALAGAATDKQGFDAAKLISQIAPLLFLFVLIIIFSVATEGRFLNPLNVFNVLRQVSITGMIAIGMTFVILTGGIDLSVGSIVALAGMAAAIAFKGTNQNTLSLETTDAVGLGIGGAAIAAMLVGVLCGFIQGTAITRLGIPAFIVTLGGLTIWRGLTLILSNGGPISGFTNEYRYWGNGLVELPWLTELVQSRVPIGIPIPVIIFLAFAVLAHVVLRYTRYGRHVYAVGGNPEAARLSGLNVKTLTLSVYIIVGFFAGLGGFVLSARLNSAEAVAGLGYELDVIAAVVIGGTSLFGGEGNVTGTVIGALLIGVLVNGLVMLNVSSYVQQIIIGLIIILAVAFDRYVKSRRRS
ncbi:MAG: ABC transporter permease [Chloroflexota bacterium]|nr:ABC transporter permease [Chloroflexota bacterium]